jgi:hypothetical protein
LIAFDLRVISLGAGVQSSTMYRMSALGEIQRFDVAIFADTQVEPPWVYEQLDRLERDHGAVIPIVRASAGNLGEAVRTGSNTTGGRFAAVPFWSRGSDGREAPGRRQCTREYKIDVVKRAIRDRLGLQPGERAAGRFKVLEAVGISLDEASRAKPSRTPWITTTWPLLLEKPMRRDDCLRWHYRGGYPMPKKSACVFCPYTQTSEWRRRKVEEPEVFAEAVEYDKLIRSTGTMRGMAAQQFVSRLLVPLDEIPDAAEADDDQLDLFGNECEGMCGV